MGDVVSDVRTLSGSARASTEPAHSEPSSEKSPSVPAATEKKPEAQKPSEAKTEAKAAPNQKTDEKSAKKWDDAVDADLEYSDVRKGLVEDLLKRRKDLDAREKDIVQKEALLKATEQQLNQKYSELTNLRGEIEKLLNKQSEEETARIQSLVRIYEGMKPADAARIFNTLDMDILMEVLGRMSERKSSPVLAAMDPERAKAVTMMLAEQKKLPELPQQ